MIAIARSEVAAGPSPTTGRDFAQLNRCACWSDGSNRPANMDRQTGCRDAQLGVQRLDSGTGRKAHAPNAGVDRRPREEIAHRLDVPAAEQLAKRRASDWHKK